MLASYNLNVLGQNFEAIKEAHRFFKDLICTKINIYIYTHTPISIHIQTSPFLVRQHIFVY